MERDTLVASVSIAPELECLGISTNARRQSVAMERRPICHVFPNARIFLIRAKRNVIVEEQSFTTLHNGSSHALSRTFTRPVPLIQRRRMNTYSKPLLHW